MSAPDQESNRPADTSRLRAIPEDVLIWLRTALQPGERVNACLLADIEPGGEFGENWTFLTSRRLLVLSPNGVPGAADTVFEMPLEDIRGARVRDNVSSSELIVSGPERGRQVVRFSVASRAEASNLCLQLKEIARQLREGGALDEFVPLQPTRRPMHRCSKCGRALRRHGEICQHCIDRRRLILRLFSYLGPYRLQVITGLALTFILTALQLVPPYLTMVLVDDVILKHDTALLRVVVLLLIGVYAARSLVGGGRAYLLQWTGSRILFDLRVQVFNHLQLLRLSYYDQRQTGKIMSRITNDLSRVQQFIAGGFQELLVNVVTMVMIALILLRLNWQLFLMALAPVPLVIVSTIVFGRRIHRLYHRIWRRVGAVSGILADTIPGIRVVKSFAQERRESRRFALYSRDLMEQQLKAARISSAFFPFLGLVTGLGVILVFSVGGYMVLEGRATLGVLMAFTSYIWRFYMPIQRFGEMNNRLQHCITSAERVFEILDTDVEPIGHSGGVKLEPLRGGVEFRDVRFSYEPGKYAIDGMSFRVEPGEMIGLVGPSGAGKSTLVHLILRFYDIDEGRVLIDGHDIQELDLSAFRRQIGVVLQESYLFHGTIEANIAYAKADATGDEIISAARAANAHDFIMNLSDGYDTVVGERGQTLSGGERQRISIARAVLRDPRILILDEATASVDTETEAMIQNALERLVRNRTTFAIAHRLSTLRKADRLIVLNRGHVEEIGTHEELLETGGLYSRLCNLQSSLSKMRAW